MTFYVLVSYSLLFSSEIILKQLFASASVNIVNNPVDFVSGIIRQYSPRLRRIIVKYKEPLDQSDCWKLFFQLLNYTNYPYKLL